MVGNADSGLRRRLAARAERERERGCEKLGEGRVRGTDGALIRELGAWVCVVAVKPGDVRECARAGPRRA
jgi:hypothetical protein